MTNAERQKRFGQRRQAELDRLRGRATAGDWRERKTPEQIAELEDLARQYREADELCKRGIEMEREALLTFKQGATEALAVAQSAFKENEALVEKYNELVRDYNELLDDYNELLADEDDR